MENKQNKPRFKISIFDIIIIVVVIIVACVLIFVWRSSGKSSNPAANTKSVHYSIELSGMLAGTPEKIKTGDTIMDSDKKFIIGTVESVSIAPATSDTKDYMTGDTLRSEVPGKETATVALVCDASSTDSQITAASGYVIRVGQEVHAAGPGYAGLGYIVAINREDLGQ
ncbi:protein of unknown function [Sporobacter termitidis DSM 10068]|uniref:DUF4330 domain-containing protein n=1 Tax=Sporobacter termitidis DSM 10068 TaxID=1123282 RepID=A0A1M5WWU0_9FIRM|nr:DUF4330 family protein [Sporobacter termitidis]SHH92116.1 protein of unknown function [Sporobacter termitidis DSM 10068]